MSMRADPPPRVDINRVRAVWLSWNNRLRRRLKLAPYALNPTLNATAMDWSALSAAKGSIDHKRSPDDAYYAYAAIERWFADRGVTFANVNHATFTENIGWGTYSCDATDCTARLLSAIRSTFGMYLRERDKADHPHYASLVQENFRDIGVGVAVNAEQHRYYLTIHYGTKVATRHELSE